MKQFDKLEVHWRDAYDGPHGWVIFELYKPARIRPQTTGYFVHVDDDDCLLLCSSYYHDTDGKLVISNPMHIPVGMLTSIIKVPVSDKV